MIADRWIYQKRNVKVPWAFYLVKEYDNRNYSQSLVLDYTFYHENVNTDDHAVSRIGIRCESIEEYTNELLAEVINWVGIDHEDFKQIYEELEDFIYFEVLRKAAKKEG